MNLSKLLDLRFVIGVFFTLIGLLLLVHSFVIVTSMEGAESINRWAGVVFLAFGILMIVLSFQKEAHDEIIEEPRD
ncbi:MAG TPA: hypothetical protein VGE66_15025 [Chitinophagaceae bacterium]